MSPGKTFQNCKDISKGYKTQAESHVRRGTLAVRVTVNIKVYTETHKVELVRLAAGIAGSGRNQRKDGSREGKERKESSDIGSATCKLYPQQGKSSET